MLKKQRTYASKSCFNNKLGNNEQKLRLLLNTFLGTFAKMRIFVRTQGVSSDTLITAGQYLLIYLNRKLTDNRFCDDDISEFEITGLVALRLAMKHQDP